MVAFSRPSLLGATPDPKYRVRSTLAGGPLFGSRFRKIEGLRTAFFFRALPGADAATCRRVFGVPCHDLRLTVCQRLQLHCCGGPPSDKRRPPAAAHSKFQSSNVLNHVKHRETAKRQCIRMKRLREAVQRNFTRVPQQEGEAACTSHHSLQHTSVRSARSNPLQRVAKFTRRAR